MILSSRKTVALITLLGTIISHFLPSEERAQKHCTRALMEEGCSSTQPSPDNHYFSYLTTFFFFPSMKMSGHISHPAGILDLTSSLGSFRPCLPCMRNSLVLLPCFSGEVHGGTEMLGKRKPLLFLSFSLPRLFNIRGAQNNFSHWSPAFSFGWLCLI